MGEKMSFTFMPAVRDRVGLLIGIAGPTGAGKTLSALKIARGLAGGDDGRIAYLDTEGGRAKHYAPAKGETPGPTRFAFAHGDLKAPFTPERYLEAIDAADRAGFEVIVIDSFSHVWDGDGGLQDMQGQIVDAMIAKSREAAEGKGWKFDEVAARDKASIGAWKEPKMRHKRMVSRLLQCRAHLVICMRAEEKMRLETVEDERNGRTFKKTVIIAAKDLPPAERWVPIVERRFPYELTTSFVLLPSAPGVPVPIKLQDQHQAAVPLDQPISERTGEMLARWSRGDAVQDDAAAAPDPRLSALLDEGREQASRGMAALDAWLRIQSRDDKKAMVTTAEREKWRAIAAAADDAAAQRSATADQPSPAKTALLQRLTEKARAGTARLRMALGSISEADETLLTEADHNRLGDIAAEADASVPA